MQKPTIHKEPTIHKLEVFGGRGAGDATVFCNFALVDLNSGAYRSRIFAASIYGKEHDCNNVAGMFQDNKQGRINYDKDNQNRTGNNVQLRFNTGFKKKNFIDERSRFDDVHQVLLIDKQIEPNAQKRAEFEAAIQVAVDNGNTPILTMGEDMGELIIAWDGNIVDQVYAVLWERYGTPMLEDWKEYIFEELMDRGNLRLLTTYLFGPNEYEPTGAILTLREVELEEIIKEGINSLELEYSMEDNDEVEEVLTSIGNLTEYLTEFGTPLAENIKNTVNYRFNPETDRHHERFYDVNLTANQNGLTGLFPAQADAVMSCARTLQDIDYTFLVGEMG